MNGLTLVRNGIKKEMKDTLKRIDSRKEKHNTVAVALGYSNAQEAFNKIGKEFLTLANA